GRHRAASSDLRPGHPRASSASAGVSADSATGGCEAALANPPGATDLAVVNSPTFRRAEGPAINGHGTARAVAGLYVALTQGGLLPADLLTELRSVQAYGRDMVVGEQARWGMGGLGGNLAWFSEHGQYAFAFVTGQLGDFQRATADEKRAARGARPAAR
ncbi:MAG: hypothetical protein WCG47_33225, partial [Dermatophilaceae bacterium]